MKSKVIYILSVFTILVFLLIGCSKDQPTKPANISQYLMPLKVGNSWSYKYYQYDPSTDDTTEVEEITWIITGTKTIENSQYFVFNNDDGVAQNRNEGLFTAGYDPDLGGFFDDLFFKYPIASGQVYTYYPIEEEVDSIRIKVTEETIAVPAGVFNCYAYQFIDRSYESIFYFAPGVGLIRLKNYEYEGEHAILLSYNLK